MADETLSPKQATEIINHSYSIMNSTSKEVTKNCNSFIQELSKIWEDEY